MALSLQGVVGRGFINFLGSFWFTGVTVSFFPSQFFPRGKNGPAHSFPGEKTDRSVFSPGERFD